MSARSHGSVSKERKVSTLSCAAALVASMCLGTSAFGPESMSTAAERKANAPSQISTGPQKEERVCFCCHTPSHVIASHPQPSNIKNKRGPSNCLHQRELG